MASTRLVQIPDTASGVLAGLRCERELLAAAEIRKLRPRGGVDGHALDRHPHRAAVGVVGARDSDGWEGAPEVAEFCVPELAFALGISHDSEVAGRDQELEGAASESSVSCAVLVSPARR